MSPIAALLVAAYCRWPCPEPPTPIPEASGIVRMGDDLLIVSDAVSGTYFRVPIPPGAGTLIPATSAQPVRQGGGSSSLAIDLEGIDVLADGRVALLSERLHSLVHGDRVVVEYPKGLSELGNRGLEGLAVRPLGAGDSMIAVLWEGGYPQPEHLPHHVAERVEGRALKPLVVTHSIAADSFNVEADAVDDFRLVELNVPVFPGQEPHAQRFRAPDLVWHRVIVDGKSEWGFIVLLLSENGTRRRTFENRWLLRFDAGGDPVGEPVDLDAEVGEELRGANWEGLGWFETSRSLALVFDQYPHEVPTSAVVVRLRAWQ